MNNHKEEQLLKQMIEILAQESGETVSVEGKTLEELKTLWRGFVNVRQPKEASADYIVLENEYLQEYHAPRVQTLADCGRLQMTKSNCITVTCVNYKWMRL